LHPASFAEQDLFNGVSLAFQAGSESPVESGFALLFLILRLLPDLLRSCFSDPNITINPGTAPDAFLEKPTEDKELKRIYKNNYPRRFFSLSCFQHRLPPQPPKPNEPRPRIRSLDRPCCRDRASSQISSLGRRIR